MALKVAGAPRSPRLKVLKSKEQNFTQGEPPKLENHKEKVNIIVLVATFVATVTYAAGFTIPDGYDYSGPDQGMATMLPNMGFDAFLICDTTAMNSSIFVALTLIWAKSSDINSVLASLKFALPVLGLALEMMSMAFMAGVCIVVYADELNLPCHIPDTPHSTLPLTFLKLPHCPAPFLVSFPSDDDCHWEQYGF